MTIVAPGEETEVHQHLHPVDVEERQDGDEGVVGRHVEHGLTLHEVGDEVAVREHHALRQAGGARRVRQDDDVVGGDRHLLAEGRTVDVGERTVPVGVADDVHLGDRRVLHRRRRRVEEHRHGDEPGRPGIDELMMNLALGVGGVDRRDHATGEGDGMEEHGIVGTIGRHDRHDLVAGEPIGEPAAGLTANGIIELGVGERGPGRAIDEGGLVSQLGRTTQGERRERLVGDLASGNGLVKIMEPQR